ncbi:MAG: pilin [Gammaproteobacteria bacterium]
MTTGCQRGWAGLLLLFGVVLAAPAADQPPAAPALGALADQPYLRGVLPPDTLAYMRIPSPLGYIGEPKGNVFDPALKTPSVRAALANLGTALGKNLLTPLQPLLGPLPGVLFAELRSPLEMIVLRPAAPQAPPATLLSVKLDSPTVSEVNHLFATLAAGEPNWQVAAPLDSAGFGQLVLWGTPASMFFDAGGRRLFLAPLQDRADLERWHAALKPNPNPPFAKVEDALDQSGQGLFLWLDGKPLGELAAPLAGEAVSQQIASLRIEYLAAGVGVSHGKSRMRMVAGMPPGGMRALLPPVDAAFDFTFEGEPSMVAMLALPSTGAVHDLEQFIGAMTPDSAELFAGIRQAVLNATGSSLDDWLDSLGPELAYISNALSNHIVLRLRDPDRFVGVLQRLQQQPGIRYETRTIAGNTYAHLQIATSSALPANLAGGDAEMAALQQLLTTHFTPLLSSHVYWKQEGAYLIIDSVPQTLVDRDLAASKTPVGQWLADSQRINARNALALLSVRSAGIPQTLYGWNLELLQMAGDLAQQPVDLFVLPSATQLNLPTQGGYSMKIGAGEREVELELTYEHNPLEILMIGNGAVLTTVAVTGILAAIAIPAYEDYTVRAEVAAELSRLDAVKATLAEFYLAKGRFPTQRELPKILQAVGGPGLEKRLKIEPKSGVVRFTLALDRLGEDNVITLTPQASGDQINWRCVTTILAKYLPTPLRDVCGQSN